MRNISFFDLDLDEGDIVGSISWIEPEDMGSTTQCVVFLTENTFGANRIHLATVNVSTGSLTILSSVNVSHWGYVAVYTMTGLVKQTAPATLAQLLLGAVLLARVNLRKDFV